MSYNDRINDWAERNSKKLKILYCIWASALVIVTVGYGAGFFENIIFDADKIPVGFMDEKP